MNVSRDSRPRNFIAVATAGLILWLVISAVGHAQLLLPSDDPGRVLSEKEISNFNAHVWPDGSGLPQGEGDAAEGRKIYEQRCAACHGGHGEGGSAYELVGENESLASDFPDRGIAAMWPHAPTLFEYVRRSMPPSEPYSLSVDDTYAVIAHLLALNGLLEAGETLDAAKLSAIELPNRDGFIDMHASP